MASDDESVSSCCSRSLSSYLTYLFIKRYVNFFHLMYFTIAYWYGVHYCIEVSGILLVVVAEVFNLFVKGDIKVLG